MSQGFKSETARLEPQLIEWRRKFHRHPETAFEEHRTSRIIRDFLENLDIRVTSFSGTGLCGILEGRPGGKTVALRADMDALPLREEGDKDYISLNPEAAHACGHDGHMAAVMGAAELLSRRRDSLPGRVAFLFQPSEERIPGGAKGMIEEGALDGVDAIFGFHFWQPLPTGMVGLVKGPMMAQPDAFTIKIKGKGGHGSMPHQAVDSILVASQIVVAAQSIVSRSADPIKPCVVSFGTIHGGTIYNIIPGEVTLTGTVRTFDPELKEVIEKRLRKIVEGVCRTFGAEAEIKYENGYPPVINPPEMVDFVQGTAESVLGTGKTCFIDPVMGGEDFAYFLQKIPGAFFFFGMGDGMKYPHHHPAFDMDEKALAPAAFLMTEIAWKYLSGKA